MTSAVSTVEIAALDEAAALAARGAGTALPNPVVGCVLLDPAGGVVGRGWHERAGGPHAEVVALAEAGAAAAGSTAVVTLEPCNHTGRTGPCSAALLAAGVVRVLVAVRDPFLPAAGGIEHLRAAGVEVVDLSAVGADDPAAAAAVVASRQVNRVWLTAVARQRPYVTVKAGMTLDGRVAAPDGTSRWITSAESRADVHRLRGEVDTMLVGVGTVLADDPALTARGADGRPTGRQPLRVVLDSAGRTPAGARVRDDAAPTWIVTADETPATDTGLDLAGVLAELYRRGRRHVLVEGGPRVAASFFDAGLVDEALFYLAPTVLGAGTPAVAGGAAGTLTDRRDGELVEVTRLGPDVRLRVAFPSAGR
ncbi:diaminohydroxyphosphoribosylaminopyrimidine deaminase/5-amino-6-(5-phosphoribosylamino)uracil reductase [Nakamurella flavida]|nr:bifunctional diaminohydroxyphosphoribosylaminopyrimidine deaminase/5-amino-6-(5-phosphoribosylamino)uracil reductase RibD [Nakamurella flavida]MDP9779664.1 diaminohydroxyphosphoribosylaminopyrimidine deaminase/5-amino-6-(5-phosphoribosylamino)uracil reductase [Nakamurella flavida]